MIFIFPTELEAAKFRVACPTAEVVICGVGLVECAATVAKIATQQSSNTRIILAGIAGAYDTQALPPTTVVEVREEVVEELPQKFRKRYTTAPIWELPTATSNSVNSPGVKGGKGSAEAAEAEIENMEGAAAAAICNTLGLPFSQIRAISNRVGEPLERWSIEPALQALTIALTEIFEHNKK